MNSEKNSKDKRAKKNKRPSNFLYDFMRITGALPVLIWMRTRKYRPYGTKTPRGGVLITANHTSMCDPVILLSTFPTRRLNSLATSELFGSPFTRFLFRHMQCIEVDRGSFSLSTFNETVDRLRLGRAVFIFPEGRISREEPLSAFKSGAALMAYRAGTPVLPVYIAPREHWYERQRVVIGECINIADIVGERPTSLDFERATEHLRERERALREYYEELPRVKKKRERLERKKVKKEE